jgi:hypothetical protein
MDRLSGGTRVSLSLAAKFFGGRFSYLVIQFAGVCARDGLSVRDRQTGIVTGRLSVSHFVVIGLSKIFHRQAWAIQHLRRPTEVLA